LDTQELAGRYRLKRKTLDNWRSLGIGPPFYKVGNRILYDDAEADAWLASRRRTSTSDPGPTASSAP
jgi:hypothetical protein